jgi:thiamine-monophosphate kinase
MRVSETGEFGLIEILKRLVEENRNPEQPAWKNLTAGIGDDAAAWNNSGETTLITTDCLVQDVHFRLGQVEWNSLGWKALAVNLSDIAAMGGKAEYAVVTLGIPGDIMVEDIVGLYKGMLELGNQFGVVIAGGDITSSKTLFISMTVTGSAGKQILKRSAARPGDLVAITGYTGAAAAGFRLISGETAPSPGDAPLRQAFLRPFPRLAEGAAILNAGGRCAIDISDGLLADLGHICRASNVAARINIELAPVHPAARKAFPEEALDMALGGGEDYELLFTAGADVIEEVKNKTGVPVTVIGEITSGTGGTVQTMHIDGRPFTPGKTGWDHFDNTWH